MSSADLIKLTTEDGVATITLDDPDHRNVFTLAMSDTVHNLLDELEADENISALIVTGAGSAFSAGGHLDELLANQGPDGMRRIYAGFLRIAESTLPTIAAVNGPAVGAGMNLALACDVIIAGESARFDSRFLQIGIGPGGGHTWRLRRAASLQTTKAMVLFGEVLDGPAAARVGLAWSCVSDDELLAEANRLAARAARAPRELLLRTKKTIAHTEALVTSAEAVDNELDTQVWSMGEPAFNDMVAALKARMAGGKR